MGYDIGFAPTEEMMGKYNIPLLGFNRIPELNKRLEKNFMKFFLLIFPIFNP